MPLLDLNLHEHDCFRFRDSGDNQRVLSVNDESNHVISTEEEQSIKEWLHTISRDNAKLNSGNDKNPIDRIKGMGVEYDFPRDCFTMSYYIGADWLDPDQTCPIVVRPKLEDSDKAIDFQSMLMACAEDEKVTREHPLDELFYVDTTSKKIAVKKDGVFDRIEPLMIVLFLQSVSNILRKGGLRKDYIQEEDNLRGKIKGKVLFSKHIKANLSRNRKDLAYCQFQEYSIDCPDNRLIKKALLLCSKKITSIKTWGKSTAALSKLLRYCLPAFETVSTDISISQIKNLKVNPVFKQYKTAIHLAKMIIEGNSHLITDDRSENNKMVLVPPFRIDMARLFERYVYHLLNLRYKNIRFQIKGHGNIMDFCKPDENLVIDAKYKTIWSVGTRIDHDNVRQLAGYARLIGFRKDPLALNASDDVICPCLIIYPDIENGIDTFNNNNLLECDKIKQVDEYLCFYKIGITLPWLKSQKRLTTV